MIRRTGVMQVLLLVVVIGLWQALAATSARAFISSPADVAELLRSWLFGPDYVWLDAYATVRVAFIGLILGCLVASATALLLAQVDVLSRFLSPFVAAANVLPKVALIPLFILWFGVGDLSKVTFVAIGVFFIVFYSVFTSVLQVAKNQEDHLRVLGASWWWRLRELILPTVWGALISSARLSVAFALLGGVLTEMMGSNNGLGYLLAHGQATVSPAQVMAAIVLVAIVGVGADALLSWCDRRLARWRDG
ncbi:ABC transporter permease [Amycolatopsis jejuensis]|uniref:ABC transporter permease n=1 Tax=Amycolatopsis jejuensis TaxID=330084 RepID=UPI0005268D3A|nr:ABC transporter permease [Amycolatopsis jejuensis]